MEKEAYGTGQTWKTWEFFSFTL